MNRHGVVAKGPQTYGGDPVGQRRFLKIPNAVDVQRDPVAGAQHGLCRLGVGCVGVVQQGRRSDGPGKDDRPQREHPGERRGDASLETL